MQQPRIGRMHSGSFNFRAPRGTAVRWGLSIRKHPLQRRRCREVHPSLGILSRKGREFATFLGILHLAAATATAQISLTGSAAQGGLVFGHADPLTVASLTLENTQVSLTPNGDFVLGFGREAPVSEALAISLKDGSTTSRSLPVKQRHYRTERVNGLPPKTVELSPEDEVRRKGEVALIVEARNIDSDQTGWLQHFSWPAIGPIGGTYGSVRIRNGVPGSPHGGVDIKQPAGTPVKAPASGIVRLAGPDYLLEGGLIIIDHGHGLFSDFMHLSRLDVTVGDRVAQGQQIGAIGATGRATGPHLHWGMRWHEVRIDPQLVVGH